MVNFTEVSKAISEVSKKSMDMPKFGEKLKNSSIDNFDNADKPLVSHERSRILPKEGGIWTGERGNSMFKLNLDDIPQKKNLENKTWGEILPSNIEGINYNDGEPDFTVISKSSVKIDEFSDERRKNFKQADILESQKRGCTPSEVKDWREANNYTWHERSDCKTMDLVPSIVHNNIPHSGGISEIKKRNGEI